MTSSLTRSLTEVLSKPVEHATRERAALHVIDWIGCAVIGAGQSAGKIFLKRAATQPSGSITVIGSFGLASPEEAAFLNGGLGSILEMDDVHRTAILHPGPVVIPAALAAAQASQTCGLKFLDAIVKGYDADIRLGESVGDGHYAKWHNTSTCGPFGSAFAVGEVLGLTSDQRVWALGNAGTQASGPWRCRHEAVMTKQLHTARAAQSGYLAASLAADGFSGAEFILEGEQGFYDAMCPNAKAHCLLSDKTGPWKIWETSFKPWPACRHAHPAIDAALVLKKNSNIENIRAIEVETFRDAKIFCDRQKPVTSHEAKFSIQHAVAVCLTEGLPTLEHFQLKSIKRPKIARLRDVISVKVSNHFNSAYPEHFGASITIYTKGGIRETATIRDALGDPENPLSSGKIIKKARNLMCTVGISDNLIERIVSETLALPNASSLANFSSSLDMLRLQLDKGTCP